MKNMVMNDKKNENTISHKILFNIKNFFVLLGLYILNTIFPALARVPFIIGKTFGIDSLFSTIIASVLLIFGVFIFYKIGARYKLINLSHIFTKKRLLIITVGFIAMQIIGFTGIFLQGDHSNRIETYATMFQHSSPLVAFVQLSIFSPITEEIIFRGFIVGRWLKDSPLAGIIISAVLFSMVHFPNNIFMFMQHFIGGVVYAIIYYKYKKLELTTSIHLLNNLSGGLQMLFTMF